ncbi:MAG: ATP-dependent DNA helicase PcrA [Planctomycetota bacterium]|nr:MAG: ATP-dependent DNA helicase PcrA [Planctomycetota bacterium]
MEGLLESCNEAQRAAITHEEGPMLVLAGAGSGKTRVLTRRIAWLLSKGVPESRILGMTFTNKAAREMAERVSLLVPGSRIRLATFHSACARFLRRDGERLGFGRDFTIYDVSDRDQLIKQIQVQLDISPKEIRPSAIGFQISRLKNEGVHPEDYEADPYVPLSRFVSRIYRPYQEALREMNAMDFDDLLLHFLDLLEKDEALRRVYSERFPFVLVDEFQDSNQIQFRLLRHLVSSHQNLCVVGDPDQSIYSFRGADVSNILQFPEQYPGCRVIKLEENYRSTATILGFAQRVIEHNQQRYEKSLRPVLGEGEPVRFEVHGTGREEAAAVAKSVAGLLQEGKDPSEIAIFYRARHLSRALEQSLRARNLPFQIVGDLSFFDRREIKDLLAYLQVLANPFDRIALQRILNVPTRGIGKVNADRFFAAAAESGLAPVEFLRRGSEIAGIKGKARLGLRGLGNLLDEAWEPSLRSAERTLQLVLESTDYIERLCRTGTYEDAEREDNIRELLLDARSYDRERLESGVDLDEEPAVAGYLGQVRLLTDRTEDDVGPSLQLMTVHAAKGLEFDHVFVVGLEEGGFPHARSLEDPDALEEERRLFYVAATRARKTLHLSRADLREYYEGGGGFRSQSPSRFLSEGDLVPASQQGRRTVAFDSPVDDGCDPGPDYSGSDASTWEEPVYDANTGAPSRNFRKGDRVVHPNFGEGTIVSCSGKGAQAKVQVLFMSGGVRTLLLEYAGLELVEGYE